MEGNVKASSSNVWYIVGRSFEHFSALAEVTTFDAFLYAVLSAEPLGRTVGILGQGLSVLEIRTLRRLMVHFPQVLILGGSSVPSVAQKPPPQCFTLSNQHRVASARYECDVVINPNAPINKEHRLPMSLFLESGHAFLEAIMKDELGERDYSLRVLQLQYGEANIPFPVQTKLELKVKDIQLKKGQLSIKFRQRFYQHGRLSVEINSTAIVIDRQDANQSQAANAKQTLQEGFDLVGV